ncbi:hypothetical protein [Longispora urticae]
MSEPNNLLANLILEAGWSWAGLARRVNVLGDHFGRSTNYDHASVDRWIKKGQCPRHPVPALIAQALSEKLGRRVSAGDCGMVDADDLLSTSLEYSHDTSSAVKTVMDLGRAEMKRRSVLAAPFILAALGPASRDWLLSTFDAGTQQRSVRHIGMTEVDHIRDTFRHFQEMDVMRGGGSARGALVAYVNANVMPLVNETHTPEVQQALYEAAAEQTYLLGWMAYDNGQHGLAQRYLIQSLRLAEASGNVVLGAHVLAGMSDQANLLGHPREALSLARAGQRGITADDSPACLADLQILEGRAHASLGDVRAASQAVVRAEQTFGSVDHANEPEWARFIDKAYLFGEAAHTFRDLDQPDQIDRFAGESAAEAKRQGRARRGALSHAALAIGDLHRGQVESAAAKANRVLQLARQVDSSRCTEAVRDLDRRLTGYENVDQVSGFRAQARAFFGTVV